MSVAWRSGNAAVCKTAIARVRFPLPPQNARMAELAYARHLKCRSRKGLWVQIPLRALLRQGFAVQALGPRSSAEERFPPKEEVRGSNPLGDTVYWRGRIVVHSNGFENRPGASPSWVRIPPSPQIETSESESESGARVTDPNGCNRARWLAVNPNGEGTAKRADLSRTTGFVPIFCTNALIS